MPTITNPTLSLSSTTGGVTVQVSYAAQFSLIEQFLIGHGLEVQERIHLIGDDESVAGGAPVHTSDPVVVTPNPKGLGSVAVNRTYTLSRATLQEDPSEPTYKWIQWGSGRPPTKIQIGSTPNDDELIAQVELTYPGLNPLSSASTPVTVLVG